MDEVKRLLRFEVLERLGAGEGSSVYRVADPDEGRVCALKHVVRSNWRSGRFLRALGNEFRVGRAFLQPNLRRVYELRVSRNWAGWTVEGFLLMEYVQGHTLDVDPPRSVADTIEVFLQIARGMGAMHEMGYVHCDLNASNVLRSREGQVKIIDYGQSCPDGASEASTLGTQGSITPEQVLRRPMTIQTDVYSIGVMLYRCLTGEAVPTPGTTAKRDGVLLENRIATPQDLNPLIPLPLSNLVMDCIAVRPQKRPADMGQVLARLELSRARRCGEASGAQATRAKRA